MLSNVHIDVNNMDQVRELFMSLSPDHLQDVLGFAKMVLFTQQIYLSAEEIPSIDEWEATPTVVKRLLAMATDRLNIAEDEIRCLVSQQEDQNKNSHLVKGG